MKIQKKKILLTVLAVICISIAVFFFMNNNTYNFWMIPEPEDHRPPPTDIYGNPLPPDSWDVLVEHSKNQTGFEITVNEGYVPLSESAFPRELNEKLENGPTLEYIQQSLLNEVTVEEYVRGLEEYGITGTESYFEEPEFNYGRYEWLPTNETGTIPLSSFENGTLRVVEYDNRYLKEFLDIRFEYLNENPPELDRKQELFEYFLQNHKQILGEPQVTVVDTAHELIRQERHITVDIYFDKGVAVRGSFILFFKPRADIDEELLDHIKLDILRGTMGCDPYCIR